MEASVREEVARIVAQMKRPVALTLVDPDKTDNGSVGRDFRTVDEFPAAVVVAVGNLCSFCRGPARSIVSESLFACLGIGGGRGRDEFAAGVASVDVRVAGERVAHGQEGRR
eukprot:5948632-Pleurochrysis_carterae.AAC.2